MDQRSPSTLLWSKGGVPPSSPGAALTLLLLLLLYWVGPGGVMLPSFRSLRGTRKNVRSGTGKSLRSYKLSEAATEREDELGSVCGEVGAGSPSIQSEQGSPPSPPFVLTAAFHSHSLPSLDFLFTDSIGEENYNSHSSLGQMESSSALGFESPCAGRAWGGGGKKPSTPPEAALNPCWLRMRPQVQPVPCVQLAHFPWALYLGRAGTVVGKLGT